MNKDNDLARNRHLEEMKDIARELLDTSYFSEFPKWFSLKKKLVLYETQLTLYDRIVYGENKI